MHTLDSTSLCSRASQSMTNREGISIRTQPRVPHTFIYTTGISHVPLPFLIHIHQPPNGRLHPFGSPLFGSGKRIIFEGCDSTACYVFYAAGCGKFRSLQPGRIFTIKWRPTGESLFHRQHPPTRPLCNPCWVSRHLPRT